MRKNTAKVLVTIDTEPDNQWDQNLRRHPRFENIAALSTLQDVFDKFHAKVTYLTTSSVAECDAVSALSDIAKSSNCEIGSHLHSWETPPLTPQIRGDGTYLHQFPVDVQSQKLAYVDRVISEVFDHKPVSYRGGRWSFDKHLPPILAKYGYLVDSTVLPDISWRSDGGTNFKKWPHKDYCLTTENGADILEIPVSIEIRTRWPTLSTPLYLNSPHWTHVEGILRRVAGFNIVWLDPSFNSVEDMTWACDTILDKGLDHVNIVFHSSVIVPGGSPYTMDTASRDRFFERLEGLLGYLCQEQALETMTLSEFYEFRKNSETGRRR